MTFLHPILLGAGLACVAIPIAIHLLMRRRRRPVRWAAMRFLMEAYRRRQRRLRLEQLLLLAARCLLIALIALAVGRPVLERAGALGAAPAQDLYLLIDNSLASGLTDESGTSALDRSIAEAVALLGSLDGARGDRAALVLLGADSELAVFPPTSDVGQVERRVREITPTQSGMDLSGALAALAPRIEPTAGGARATVAVLSEFREGSVGSAPVLPGLGEGVRVVAREPADAPVDNTGILGATLLRPIVLTGGAGGVATPQVRVDLLRSGPAVDAGGLTRVRATALGKELPRELGSAVVEWAPGQSEARVTVDLAEGSSLGRVVLRVEIDRDANELDNSAWAVLDVREALRVAVVGTRRYGARPAISEFMPSDWLGLALRPMGDGAGEINVEVIEASRLEGAQLAGFDAAIVAEPDRVRPAGWEAIGEFAARGGAVVLAAAPAVGAQLWTESATQALALPWEIEREPVEVEGGELVAGEAGGADLLWFLRGELAELTETVRVQRVLPVRVEDGAEVLLETAGGRAVLLAAPAGEDEGGRFRGVVALLATAVDLEWSDLPARPLMVPLFQELVRSGVGAVGPQTRIAAGARARVRGSVVEVRPLGEAEDGRRSYAVDLTTGSTREPLRRSGVFEAVDEGGRGAGAIVVQADAAAGRTRPVEASRVEAWLSSVAGTSAHFAWRSERAEGRGGPSVERRGSDRSGPGLALLAAALALAVVELGLARFVSHAPGREGGTGGEA